MLVPPLKERRVNSENLLTDPDDTIFEGEPVDEVITKEDNPSKSKSRETKKLDVVVLDYYELNKLATDFNKKSLGKVDKPISISTAHLEFYIKKMEQDVIEFAGNGKFTVTWDFNKISVPKHQVQEIAEGFKKKHSKFAVISDGKIIEVCWNWRRK